MNTAKIVLMALFIISYSTVVRADTVVISFSDGKTQTIQLDGSIKSITAVQYLPSKDQVQAAPAVEKPQASRTPQDTKQTRQQPDTAKPLVKFKWADPIIGQ